MFATGLFDLSWGIGTNFGKTEGIYLNVQCDCHSVASIFLKDNYTITIPASTMSCSNVA